MAKSIRSKWKRKCRAVKRERYGKKELERLKKTLAIGNEQSTSTETNIQNLSEVVTVTTAPELKNKKDNEINNLIGDMEVDEIKKKFNTKTLRNEHGAYPVWVHPRKIKKVSKKAKKAKSKAKGKVVEKKNS